MNAKQIVEMGTAYAGISNKELADRLGWSPQVLSNRLKTGKFSVEEWETIAKALDAELILSFKFHDGRII